MNQAWKDNIPQITRMIDEVEGSEVEEKKGIFKQGGMSIEVTSFTLNLGSKKDLDELKRIEPESRQRSVD